MRTNRTRRNYILPKKLYNEVQNKGVFTLTHLRTIKYQIEKTEKLSSNLSLQNNALEQEIEKTKSKIDSIDNHLEALKKAYKKMLFNYAKQRLPINTLSFLFSSNTIGQLLTRVDYLRQYHLNRNAQINYVNKYLGQLSDYKKQLEQQNFEQKLILQQVESLASQLEKMRKENEKLVIELKKKPKTIRANIVQDFKYQQ